MVNQQLLDYIKQQLQLGVGQEQIKKALLINGWKDTDITEAFNSLIITPSISHLSAANSPVAASRTADSPAASSPNTQNQKSGINKPKFPAVSKKLKKILLIAILAITGLALVGSGVYAYFAYFQSPEKIVQKMFTRLEAIKSLEYSGKITVSAEAADLLGGSANLLSPEKATTSKKINNLSIGFSGLSDLQDINNPKSLFSLNIKTDALGEDFSFGLETRTLSKILYFQFSNLPNLGFVDLSFLKNQWIKIDTKEISKQIDLNKITGQVTSEQAEKTISLEQITKLKTLLNQDQVFKITEELANEKIGEENTYHYKFAIDKPGLKKFLADASLAIKNKALDEKELAELDKGLETIEVSEGEVWIGKKDFLPYKFTANLKLKDNEKLHTASQTNIVLFLKNFNQPAKIETPTNAKPLMELIGSLFGGMVNANAASTFNGTTTPEVLLITPDESTTTPAGLSNINKDSDNDGLTDQLEATYGTDSNNSDTDGDGFPDGEEVEKGFNPNGSGKLAL